MVSIRLQRTGRRRHAQFRVVVQDSRRAPTSGRVIANLGFYNPHTKEHGVDLEKASAYLQNGAQPSPRVVKLLTEQKVDLPAWVKQPTQKSKQTRHADKLRRNQPAAAASETVAEEEAETADQTESTETTEPAVEPEETDSKPQAEAEESAEQDSDDDDESEKSGAGSEAPDDKPEDGK